jgi:hypothetical protein
LSFWAISNGLPSYPATFSGVVRNQPSPSTRSYPFTFSLPNNVWTKVAITIPGDTVGPWVYQGNAAGLTLSFGLGTGSSFLGPANTWQSGNIHAATGAVSTVSTNAAGFNITNVKLEIGSVATPFNRPTLSKAFADCQRYYQQFTYLVGGYAGTAGPTSFSYEVIPVAMRAAPTVVFTNLSYVNSSNLTVTGNPSQFAPVVTITAAGNFYASAVYQLSAEF